MKAGSDFLRGKERIRRVRSGATIRLARVTACGGVEERTAEQLDIVIRGTQRGIEKYGSATQHQGALGVFGHEVQVMGHHDHRLAHAVQPLRKLQNVARAAVVLPRGWLVEDDGIRDAWPARRR